MAIVYDPKRKGWFNTSDDSGEASYALPYQNWQPIDARDPSVYGRDPVAHLDQSGYEAIGGSYDSYNMSGTLSPQQQQQLRAEVQQLAAPQGPGAEYQRSQFTGETLKPGQAWTREYLGGLLVDPNTPGLGEGQEGVGFAGVSGNTIKGDDFGRQMLALFDKYGVNSADQLPPEVRSQLKNQGMYTSDYRGFWRQVGDFLTNPGVMMMIGGAAAMGAFGGAAAGAGGGAGAAEGAAGTAGAAEGAYVTGASGELAAGGSAAYAGGAETVAGAAATSGATELTAEQWAAGLTSEQMAGTAALPGGAYSTAAMDVPAASSTAPAASGAASTGAAAPAGSAPAAANSPGLIEGVMNWAEANPTLTAGLLNIGGGILKGIGDQKRHEQTLEHLDRQRAQQLEDSKALEEWKRRFIQGGSFFDVLMPFRAPEQPRQLRRPDGSLVRGGIVQSEMQ